MFKRVIQSSVLQTLAAWAAAHYVTFVARRTDWRIEGEPALLAFATGEPRIVVFWHESLPSMPVFWLRAKQAGLRRNAAVLASRHRDGRLIGQAVANLGIGVVAGSSSRGGAAGLRLLINGLAGGAHVGLTPDGPRGPRRIAAPGVAQLAAMTGVPVLPCGAWISRAVTLKSWDRMRLPLPFGRGVLVCGATITVPRDHWSESLLAIEQALNAAMEKAEAG